MNALGRLLLPPASDASNDPSEGSARPLRRGSWWLDLVVPSILGLATVIMAYRNGLDLNPTLYEWVACDAYFDADTPRVLLDMTGRFNDHYRTRVHPLFPLITIPPEKVLEKGLG